MFNMQMYVSMYVNINHYSLCIHIFVFSIYGSVSLGTPPPSYGIPPPPCGVGGVVVVVVEVLVVRIRVVIVVEVQVEV